MFKGGQFDVIEVPMPAAGMNQNISREMLPMTQTYLLENIIPMPLGQGQVRHGTRRLENIVYDVDTNPNGLKPDATIQEIFTFSKTDGTEQLLLYVQEFERDANVTEAGVDSSSRFHFKSPNRAKYLVDTPIKVVYEKSGIQTLYADITTRTEGAANLVTLDLVNNGFPVPFAGGTINEIYYPTGKIYCYNLKTKVITRLKAGLAINSVPRSVLFKNQLILCNGVDRMMQFNGTDLSIVYDFVMEQAGGFNRTSNTTFTFTIQREWDAVFRLAHYQNNVIQLKVNNVTHTLNVTNAAKADLTITLTTAENLPAFEGNKQLLYRDTPPPFSYLYVLNNRLWALGAGAVGLDYRSEPLKVYYTYKPESLNNWFDERSQQVPYIDLSNKHGVVDNLEAITSIGEQIAFIGRHHTQIWQGKNPLDANDFIWQRTLSVGIAHGNLVQSIGNDVFFVSNQGVVSFGTLNVAKQFAVSSLNAVDPLVRKHLKTVMASNKNYWLCRSFYYKEGAFAGFKIGKNKTIIAITDTTLSGWSLFSGVFLFTHSFVTNFNRLFITNKNTVLEYADGKVGAVKYTDDNQGFTFNWVLPIISHKAKKYACKRYAIEMEYPSSFVIDARNRLSMRVFGDLPKTFQLESPYRVDFKGDVLDTIPLGRNDHPKSLGMRLNEPYQTFKRRLKFVSTSFWGAVSGMIYEGPLIFKHIKFYGRKER